MKQLRLYPAVAFLFVLILIASAFALPLGYSYDETCPECHGEGKVSCRNCGL